MAFGKQLSSWCSLFTVSQSRLHDLKYYCSGNLSEHIKTTLCGKNEDIANAEASGANAVELHLSGLTGTTSHSDMQKIRIIGFFFENKLH